MVSHAFVDESVRRDYIVCAVVVGAVGREEMRKLLRGLRRPGAHRLHMAKESAEHRKRILADLCAMPVAASVYVSRYPVDRDGRSEIMRRMVADLPVDGLVIESGVGQDERDRVALYGAVRKAGLEGRFSYTHLAPRNEPLLWLPDAIAWAWGAGKDWRQRVRPLIAAVVVVEP